MTSRASVATGGTQGNGVSGQSSTSADGRYVAFVSNATNLVAGDTNGKQDVFVRDRQLGATERVSVDSSGAQSNDFAANPALSADGRYVAFGSTATNLVAGDTNAKVDVFVRDRQLGTTERVSVDSSGAQGDGHSTVSSISADGRYVAFVSSAANLVSGDTNGAQDAFVRDRQLGVTERVSVDSAGSQANGATTRVSVSFDGRYVAFGSAATNLVGGDTNGSDDVFVRDRQLGVTERVSVDSSGAQGNGGFVNGIAISADGRYVAFQSQATNLVAGDTNGSLDVFVHDRQLDVTVRASVDSSGAQGNGNSFGNASISADGRCVVFDSGASNLVGSDTNGTTDVFVRDLQAGTTERVSVDSSGAQANGSCHSPSVSADGRYVAFEGTATNLVGGDTNALGDVFVRDRNPSGFTSTCDPGVAGTMACPCSNPPSGAGRGCDNSAATGGASLAASGLAYLSADSLVFTTSGEKPTALSTVWQGPMAAPAGIVFGQGVRCVGGTLKRLYHKSAVGGSILAPNLGGGDPTVSARSAALGVPISAGQSRYYFVSYRDPTILGGCPSVATINATHGGRVDWSP